MEIKRDVSWSMISSFHYNKREWYEKYVLGKEQVITKELTFGKKIGKQLETDPKFLPMVERHDTMEKSWRVKFNGYTLVGYADSFCEKTKKKIAEYKTGKNEWTQKRVDEHGQLTMYCLLNFIENRVKAEDTEIKLFWLPTMETPDFELQFVPEIEKNIKYFTTKRTTKDLIKFGKFILDTIKEMESYTYNP